jgi:nucleoside-diphosphate-sugar epimerase
MSVDTVAVTGGNGIVGEVLLEHFNEHGYETVNVARGKRREEVSDKYRTTDLLDAGQVYGSLASSDADAVVHMGTIRWPIEHPWHVTYESQVMTTYHVLEAATQLGIDDVVLPSSINVMGCVYQDPPTEVEYLPVDEDHPLTPRDPYAVGKHSVEVTADGFGRLADGPTSIATLRCPWVASEDEICENFVEPDRDLAGLEDAWHHTTRDVLFSYIHAEDAAAIARRAVEAEFEGHERFWAVASDTTAEVLNEELVAEYYPDAEVRADLGRYESLISIDKAMAVLDWEPEHSWRDLES